MEPSRTKAKDLSEPLKGAKILGKTAYLYRSRGAKPRITPARKGNSKKKGLKAVSTKRKRNPVRNPTGKNDYVPCSLSLSQSLSAKRSASERSRPRTGARKGQDPVQA